ncbi:Arabinose operon regulatory protein [Rhodobacteraceae bacterium THAF1]|uniref:helix-turn-helix domain-containing protein n=1 Tax=Palleronia sp. THAF1 TaxID=2587842 RepID=UPI000F3B13F6|nr:AraC family transcriptional regulator [Palleronia sp. THAF1]QFU08896.1 Arabinose operon regulatory protein [Palleronia sp. THAF1]VDC24392.1 Arabinose operon regulatory protein [Rhodobacteraceae bacterium THAF1]
MLDFTRPTAGPSLVSLPKLIAGGRWRTAAMRSYSQPVLYWFTRGEGRMTVQGVYRPFHAYEAILLPAGTMHGFEGSDETDGSLLFLPSDVIESLPEDMVTLHIDASEARDDLNARIEDIRTELTRGTKRSERALGFHLGLLAVWLERQAQYRIDEVRDPRAHETLAEAYTSLLERYFRDGHTVADFARALGVTPAHLSRACRKASGRPASAFLKDRVNFEARRLLAETRMPISEVAATLGFTSHAYFTRAFQSLNGQTPSAFRRSA